MPDSRTPDGDIPDQSPPTDTANSKEEFFARWDAIPDVEELEKETTTPGRSAIPGPAKDAPQERGRRVVYDRPYPPGTPMLERWMWGMSPLGRFLFMSFLIAMVLGILGFGLCTVVVFSSLGHGGTM